MKAFIANLCKPLPPWQLRRKDGVNVLVVVAVIAGHILFACLMIMDFQPAKAMTEGQAGTVLLASLVSADGESSTFSQPVTFPKAKSTPSPDAVKHLEGRPAQPPTEATKVEPINDVAVHEIYQMDTSDASSVETVSFNEATVLSQADAVALAQFAPASANGDPNAPCDLTPAMARDFGQNPLVRQALDRLPANARSVSNGVMMWDNAWPAESQSGGMALLRAFMVREISASRPECLEQDNHGPVFFLVPDGSVTVAIAVGSGVWNWGQLLQ